MLKFTKSQGYFALIVVTVIWGSGFVVTKLCLNAGVSASFINIIRGSALMLLTFAFFPKQIFRMSKRDIKVGIIAGSANAVAFILQAVGLKYTTPTMSGFLTIMHIIFVPLIVLVFYRKKPKAQMAPAVMLSLIGTIVLTGVTLSNLRLGKGEGLSLLGAFSFGLSIAYIGNSGKGTNTSIIAFWMGVTHTLISLLYFAIDTPIVYSAVNWGGVILPLLYLSVLGTFICSNIQVYSQKVIDETAAAIIMSLEAVFGAIISLIFGFDIFSWNLVVGGILIFIGVLIAIGNFNKVFKKRK